jgi:hypothetical protein
LRACTVGRRICTPPGNVLPIIHGLYPAPPLTWIGAVAQRPHKGEFTSPLPPA